VNRQPLLHRPHNGLTLIELLVVISVIALLTAILVPALKSTKSQAAQVVCANNLRQLAIANLGYGQENNGYSVPGAYSLFSGNLHRWYGTRQHTTEPFDPDAGPLAPFLSNCRPACPQRVAYVTLEPTALDYESGNGGYGYNLAYLGSQIWNKGYEDHSYMESTKLNCVKRPVETLAFADTSMYRNIDGLPSMIPYAFAEPRFLIINRKPDATWRPYPSIHFRHRKNAGIAWVDGHVDSRKLSADNQRNGDGTRSSDQHLGWFEPVDNSLFDLW
jgi:prepilin-type N-terminal cleavage/methylation domain-containing protein/prepilin-type processing-associated H-X9-DG protein